MNQVIIDFGDSSDEDIVTEANAANTDLKNTKKALLVNALRILGTQVNVQAASDRIKT
jgi:hypothetical protein